MVGSGYIFLFYNLQAWMNRACNTGFDFNFNFNIDFNKHIFLL